jgi:hypothetical protein
MVFAVSTNVVTDDENRHISTLFTCKLHLFLEGLGALLVNLNGCIIVNFSIECSIIIYFFMNLFHLVVSLAEGGRLVSSPFSRELDIVIFVYFQEVVVFF